MDPFGIEGAFKAIVVLLILAAIAIFSLGAWLF